MLIEKIKFITNSKFQKAIRPNINYADLAKDNFEKDKTFEQEKYKDLIQYRVIWGWSNFKYPDTGFFARFPLHKKLNILKNNDIKLRDVAQSLCMYPNEDIKNFTTIFNFSNYSIDYENSKAAYTKIMPYVTEEREKLFELLQTKERLNKKQEKYILNPLESQTLQIVEKRIEEISKKCKNAEKKYLITKHYKENTKNSQWHR